MRFRKRQSHVMDVLFVIALFGVFAVCAFLVTLIGANVYRNVTNAENAHYVTRTASAYLLEKVRTGDSAGNISVESHDGMQVLVIRESYDNTAYATYIYCSDGKLKELFGRQSAGFHPENGTDVMELANMTVTKQGNLLRFTVAADTPEESVFTAYLASAGGDAS